MDGLRYAAGGAGVAWPAGEDELARGEPSRGAGRGMGLLGDERPLVGGAGRGRRTGGRRWTGAPDGWVVLDGGAGWAGGVWLLKREEGGGRWLAC